jgi:hypothetical protein
MIMGGEAVNRPVGPDDFCPVARAVLPPSLQLNFMQTLEMYWPYSRVSISTPEVKHKDPYLTFHHMSEL